jgi:nitroreductase
MAVAALLSRRTIRSYQPEYVIPKEVLETIVGAALVSPSGYNRQGLDLLVVSNRELLDKAADVAYATWPQPLKDMFAERRTSCGVKNTLTCDASTVIFLVKNERASDQYLQVDAGVMIQSIAVAAREFDLDTLPVAVFLEGDPAQVEATLAIPKDSLAMAIAIGKSKLGPVTRERVILAKANYIN